ncbi:hypothetical protein JXO52_05665 [bacterium]|nr:hypothetical protein [bacterium]
MKRRAIDNRVTYLVAAAIAALFLGEAGSVFSQTGVSVSMQTVFDQNAFRNYEQLPDIISQPDVILYHILPNRYGSLNLFYNGSASIFRDYSVRQYYHHSFGLTGSTLFSPVAPRLNYGIQAGRRFNRIEYNYYDYQHLDAHCDAQFDNHESYTFTIGTRFRMREYRYLPEFSNNEWSAHLKAGLYLKTSSTIIVQAQAGYKSFVEEQIDAVAVEEMDWSSRGPGRGKGPNAGTSGTESAASDVRVISPGNSVFQLAGSFRLSQSIGSRTGMAIVYRLQRNQAGAGRVLSGQDAGYETNDDLFDDPYSYDLDELSAELTRILPFSARLQFAAAYSEKEYKRPVYDLTGVLEEGVTRFDEVWMYWGTLQKTIPLRRVLTSITLSLTFMMLDNGSNDPYYRYTNRITSIGLSLLR